MLDPFDAALLNEVQRDESLTADALAERFTAARELTGEPLGVNLFAPQPSAGTPEEIRAYADELAGEAQRYGVALGDPRYDDDLKRGENGPVISERMGRWCAERTVQEAVDTLGKAQIPAAPVLSPQAALDHPHVQAGGFMQQMDYPGLPRPAPISRVALKLSRTPGEIHHRAPVLGEHTQDVLGSLGYDEAAIAALREKGVV